MKSAEYKTDVLLIGAGIMSATLGMMIHELLPQLNITIYERLDKVAAESSDAWNNAGTGHSAFCELNYTPAISDGSVNISKAIKIANSFEQSKQFWSYLVANGRIGKEQFITTIPHMSFVWGADNKRFLKARYEAMSENPLFEDMRYSEDHQELKEWIPLMMEGRSTTQQLAATRVDIGTDVNFGSLTRAMIHSLSGCDNVEVKMGHEIRDIKNEGGKWVVKAKDLASGEKHYIEAQFVFIGAGGGSLSLLDMADIPEAKGYGGFPISGQWLKCVNEAVITQHHAKVYGLAEVGSPPMSVPHLDTRMIDGKQALLFGPYAGFSTKFLKSGSYMDLPKSLEFDNVMPMMMAGFHNIPLTKYLIEQVMQSPQDRLDALHKYYPHALMEDWELAIAGQRVQIIKSDEAEGGILEFGTEIVGAANGTISALLGASPGASTSVAIMLEVLQKSCYGSSLQNEHTQDLIHKMIPSYNRSLAHDHKLCCDLRKYTDEVLSL